MHQAFLRLTYRLWAHTGSSDPRPSTGVERTLPHPSEGGYVSDTAPPSPRRIETPRLQEQEGGEEEEEKERRRQQGERLEKQLEQCRQQELLELQKQQQQQWSQQLEELLEQPPQSPRQLVLPSPQGPETREEGLPIYDPPTPAWLRPGGPASILAEPGRKDGVVAIVCAMRTPADPQSEIKGSLYGIDGIAPGFLRDQRPWEEPSAEEGDDAGTSGGGNANEIGT